MHYLIETPEEMRRELSKNKCILSYSKYITNIRNFDTEITTIDFNYNNFQFAFDIRCLTEYRSHISLIWRKNSVIFYDIFRIIKIVRNEQLIETINYLINNVINFLNSDKRLNKVSFLSIQRISKFRIEFTVLDESFGSRHKENLFFEFNCENNPSDAALSLAFISLSRHYEEVYIDLDIDNHLFEIIKLQNTQSTQRVYFRNIRDNILLEQKTSERNYKIALLFSGGIDSLAALCVLPKDKTILISNDYGGIYERESVFFKKFNPIIFKSNFRISNFFVKLEHRGASFFSISCLLLCESLMFSFYATGDILEANQDLNCNMLTSSFPTNYFGLRRVYPVFGLTEVGTTLIVYKKYINDINFINESLDSLATIGTIKRLRKEILFRCVGANIEIHKLPKKLIYGKDFVMDFLVLYIIKKDKDLALELLYEIPNNVYEFVRCHNLDFFCKINPKCFISFYRPDIVNSILKNCFAFGIDLYSINDYRELLEVCIFLSQYHKNTSAHTHLLGSVYSNEETKFTIV